MGAALGVSGTPVSWGLCLPSVLPSSPGTPPCFRPSYRYSRASGGLLLFCGDFSSHVRSPPSVRLLKRASHSRSVDQPYFLALLLALIRLSNLFFRPASLLAFLTSSVASARGPGSFPGPRYVLASVLLSASNCLHLDLCSFPGASFCLPRAPGVLLWLLKPVCLLAVSWRSGHLRLPLCPCRCDPLVLAMLSIPIFDGASLVETSLLLSPGVAQDFLRGKSSPLAVSRGPVTAVQVVGLAGVVVLGTRLRLRRLFLIP